MSVTFELDAEVRTDMGKGASRRLRHANKIPAVMYGGGADPVSLTMDHNKIAHALENEAFYSHILTINIGGKPAKAILRDLQRHPAKLRILHADFQRVNMKEKLHMNVPLHFINAESSPGVKTSGGNVSHVLTEVDISCLPKDLPEFIAVDLVELAAGNTLHLSDLVLPKNTEILSLAKGGNDLPVVTIVIPRAVISEGGSGDAADEAAADSEENKEAE